jgi:hypothetical protein
VIQRRRPALSVSAKFMDRDELTRSGGPDFYPFVISKAMVAKLQFVHLVAQNAISYCGLCSLLSARRFSCSVNSE